MSDKPRLHQSLASILVNKSPLHCWFKAFGQVEEEWDSDRNNGTLCHKLVLGGKDIVSIDAKDWRTSAAKEQRDAAIMAGKIPELAHKIEKAGRLAGKVVQELQNEHGISISDGMSELTLQWNAGSVECEGTLDNWNYQHARIVDLKFTKIAASPENIGRLMVATGADIQAAAYRQSIEFKHPELAGRIESLYVYVEVDEPNAITVVRPNGEMLKLGESKWNRACEIWQNCLEKYGTATPWPSYASGIVDVSPPSWAWEKEKQDWEIMERQESNTL